MRAILEGARPVLPAKDWPHGWQYHDSRTFTEHSVWSSRPCRPVPVRCFALKRGRMPKPGSQLYRAFIYHPPTASDAVALTHGVVKWSTPARPAGPKFKLPQHGSGASTSWSMATLPAEINGGAFAAMQPWCHPIHGRVTRSPAPSRLMGGVEGSRAPQKVHVSRACTWSIETVGPLLGDQRTVE